MKPLNCCRGCKELNKNGTFKNKLRCMFCDAYGHELIMKLYNEQKANKSCSTCKNCKRVCEYPSYVLGEECDCTVGLQCDTVFFKVKDCPKWIGKFESEDKE